MAYVGCSEMPALTDQPSLSLVTAAATTDAPTITAPTKKSQMESPSDFRCADGKTDKHSLLVAHDRRSHH